MRVGVRVLPNAEASVGTKRGDPFNRRRVQGNVPTPIFLFQNTGYRTRVSAPVFCKTAAFLPGYRVGTLASHSPLASDNVLFFQTEFSVPELWPC